MSLKITYTDTEGGGQPLTVELPDEHIKALKTDMGDVVQWHVNAIQHKAQKMMELLIRDALRPGSPLLTTEDRVAIGSMLQTRGILIPEYADIPEDIRLEIIRRIKFPEATEGG